MSEFFKRGKRQADLEIHTAAQVTRYVIKDGPNVVTNVPEDVYRLYAAGHLSSSQVIEQIEIRETAARKVWGGNAKVEFNLSREIQQDTPVDRMEGNVQAVGRGWGSLTVEEEREAINRMAALHAEDHGIDHPPGPVKRLFQILGQAMGLFGRDRSLEWNGPDGGNVPISGPVRVGWDKSESIDVGRKSAYDERNAALSGIPGVQVVGDHLRGDETETEYKSRRPSLDSNVHISGSALGRQRTVVSLDGQARLHALADDLQRALPSGTLNDDEALNVAGDALVTYYVNGKITNLELPPPIQEPEDKPMESGIVCTSGKRVISEEEFNDNKKKRR